MNITTLQSAIRNGRSVAELAIEQGVSPGAIYSALRRAGTPVSSLVPHSPAKDSRPIPGLPGYRVTSEGVVQSCLSTRTGDQTDNWRDLKPGVAKSGNQYCNIGSSHSGAQRGRRLSLRKLIVAAWGEERGERIFERVRQGRK